MAQLLFFRNLIKREKEYFSKNVWTRERAFLIMQEGGIEKKIAFHEFRSVSSYKFSCKFPYRTIVSRDWIYTRSRTHDCLREKWDSARKEKGVLSAREHKRDCMFRQRGETQEY